MKALRIVTGILLLFLLTGCFDVATVVRVRSDGSGVVEERMLMSGELVNMTKQMQAMGGEQGEQPSLYKREELEQRAASMGPGVSLVSVEPLVDGQREGYKAVYAFADINKVTINQNPSDKAPSGPGMDEDAEKKNEPVTFSFKRGRTPELTIHFSGVKPGQGDKQSKADGAQKTGAPEDEAAAQMAMAMMKEMFKELRITLAVEVEGQIVETNATFQEGSRVTLMELDFGKLLADTEKFEAFAKSNPETLADAKTIMQDLEGVKAELNSEVHIRFAGGPQQLRAPATKKAPAKHKKRRVKSPPPALKKASVAPPIDTPPTVIRHSFGWRTIPSREANQHLSKLVRVTDGAGVKHKGMLTEVGGGKVTLELARMDGGGSVQIPLVEVRELKVFERGM